MNHDLATSLIAELLRLALLLCAPLLGVILVVGIVVSVLQAVTQVQDPSIAFVPKLVLFGLAAMLLAPWMLARLSAFGVAMFARLAG